MNSKKVNIILAVVLGIIVIGGALYYFLVVNKSDNNSKDTEVNTTANATVDNANTTQANATTQAEPPKPEYETVLSEIYKDSGNRFSSRYPSDFRLIEDDGIRAQYSNSSGQSILFQCDLNSDLAKPEDVLKDYMDSPVIVTSDVNINGDTVSFSTSRANGESSYCYYILRGGYYYGFIFKYNSNNPGYEQTLNAIKQCVADGKLIVVT